MRLPPSSVATGLPAAAHRPCRSGRGLLHRSLRQRHQSLAAALALLLALAGCGGNAADDVARLKGRLENLSGTARLIELKNLVKSHPKSGEARLLLGAQLLADQDAAAAAVELQRALALDHPQAAVLPLLAEAQNASGQAQLTVERWGDHTLADAQAQARLQAAVARAYGLLGRPQLAQAALDRALAADPREPATRLMQAQLSFGSAGADAALQQLDALLRDHPGFADGWAARGELLLRRPGARDQALAAYAQALKANPNHLHSLAAVASLHLAAGRLDAARPLTDTLRQLAPKQVNTAMLDARLAFAEGHHAQAREIYQALLRGLPDNITVLLSAGENELRLNAAQQAEAYFAKASALEPRHALARRLLAQAQVRLGQPAKALVTLAPLIDAADTPADVLALAAQARLANGEPRAADALLERLARLKPADPQWRTVLASARLNKGNDTAALAELRAIAASDPGVSADMALVDAQLRRGLVDETLSTLDALTRKRPDDPQSHQLRGQVLAQKGDAGGARQAFEAAQRANPRYYPAVAALAALDLRANQPDAAARRIQAFLKLQPRHAPAMLALAEIAARQPGDGSAALAHIQAAVKAVPHEVDAHIALINHHDSRRQIDAALSAALGATAALPDNVRLLQLLARVQLRARQTAQALSTYGKLVQLQPRSPLGHLGQAQVYLSTGELGLAQRSIDNALQLSPDLPDAQSLAVAVAMRRKQVDTALAIVRRMQSARPADGRGWLLEGDIEASRQRWDVAAAAFRKALGTSDAQAAAIKLHHALLQGGHADQAATAAERWLAEHPRDAGFLFYLGDAAQVRGDLATAEKRYQEVLTAQPEHAAALNNLAMLLLQQSRPGALALAERAARRAPDQPQVLDTLAQALAAEGQARRALETQRRAVALAPDDPTLKLHLARRLVDAGEKAKAKAQLDDLAASGGAASFQAEVAELRAGLGTLLPGR